MIVAGLKSLIELYDQHSEHALCNIDTETLRFGFIKNKRWGGKELQQIHKKHIQKRNNIGIF